MLYQEAITYLTNLTRFGFNLGLGRIEELERRLGHPEAGLRFIHLGGTNGKGSVGAMIHAALVAAGCNVGWYTSPHLEEYTERFRLGTGEISSVDLADLVEEMRPHLEEMVEQGFEHPTEFEVLTAIALRYFRREAADPVVWEVGLGGEIDSTNAIPLPLVSVITNVSLDHMDYLGTTVEEIAGVKAGIIKPGVTCVTASEGEALEVIRERCRRVGAPLMVVQEEVSWRQIEAGPTGQVVDFKLPGWDLPQLRLGLAGTYQQVNAATALLTLKVLTDQGFNLSQTQIQDGMAEVKWPARMELLATKPAFLLDSAHNAAGAAALRQSLQELYRPVYGEPVLIIGILSDKERDQVVRALVPLCREVVVTRPLSPRAGDWQEVARLAESMGKRTHVEPQLPAALKRGADLAGAEGLVVVAGSIYLVGEARRVLRNYNN